MSKEIKLSDLSIGTVLNFKNINLGYDIYTVLTDLLREDIEGKFYCFCIKGRRLFSRGQKTTFNINRITREDILSDNYSIENFNVAIFPTEDLPLLINEPNKTSWYSKVLKGEFDEKDFYYHKFMLEFLSKEK
jgi:hypothetical protein